MKNIKKAFLLFILLLPIKIISYAQTICIEALGHTIINKTISVCGGTGVNLTAKDCSNGASHDLYQWTNPNNEALPLNGTNSFYALDSGMWVVTDLSYDPPVTDTIYIKHYPIKVLMTPNTNCLGDTFSLSAIADSAFYNFKWYKKGILFNTGSKTVKSSIDINESSMFPIEVKSTHSSGCESSYTLWIPISSLPSFEVTKDTSICKGNSITLYTKATTSYFYHWTPGNFTTESIDILPDTITNFEVKATGSNGCSLTKNIQVNVIIPPQVNVGPNIISEDTTISLTWTQSNTNGILWKSSGSGEFYNILNGAEDQFYYKLSETDKTNGIVYLTLSSIGDKYCKSAIDTLEVTYIPKKLPVPSISGKIIIGNDSVYLGLVVLYKLQNDLYEFIDTIVFNSKLNNNYLFDSLTIGKYLIQALPEASYSKSFLPSYFGNKTTWSEAILIDLKDSLIENKDLHLVSFNSSDTSWQKGSDIISGTISFNAGSALRIENDIPLENAVVFLLSEQNNFLTYAYSDYNGFFKFENLKAGIYQLMVEYPGTKTFIASIQIDGDIFTQDEVFIELNRNNTVTNFNAVKKDKLIVFPTPAKDFLNIQAPKGEDLASFSISILNILGKSVEVREYFKNLNLVSLNIESLEKGIYVIKVSGKETDYVSSFYKN